MKKLVLTCLSLLVLMGCGSGADASKQRTRTCSLRQNDMDIVVELIAEDGENISHLDASMVLNDRAIMNYSFGSSVEEAILNLDYLNQVLDETEKDGYETELVVESDFLVMKLHLEIDELDEQIQAQLGLHEGDDILILDRMIEGIETGNGSCRR